MQQTTQYKTAANPHPGSEYQDAATPNGNTTLTANDSYAEAIPLSFEQTRIWAEETILKSANYNEVSAWKLTGPLNAGKLSAALRKIISRHSILRTTFPLGEQGPYQHVMPEMELALHMKDFSSLPEVEQPIAIDLAISAEAAHAFNLSQLPLFRVSLLKINEGEHVLILCAHHIIFDGWSNEVFARELALFYENPDANSASGAAPLPIQYADFAVFQNQSIAKEVLENQLSFWKAALQDLPTLNGLQSSRSTAGSRMFFDMDAQLTVEVRKLCKQAGVTPFLFFTGVFQLLLGKRFNLRDVPVGVPVSNRDTPQTQSLIGFFVNTIIVRSKLSADMSFMDLLARLREYMSKAVNNKHVPFHKVVAALKPTRDANLNSLFQYMFDYRKTSAAVIQLGQLKAEPVRVKAGSSRFDIFMCVLDGKTTLSTSWEYQTDLFTAAEIQDMEQDLRQILQKLADDPNAQVSQLIGSSQNNSIEKQNTANQPVPAQTASTVQANSQDATASQEKTALTPLQQQIAGIWQEILGLSFVTIDDDFFKIGGDSLMAIRVHNRLLSKLRMEQLSITDIFNFPTIGGLSEHLEKMMAAAK